MAPRPHLALHIALPAETAHARKPDGTTLQSRQRLVSAYEAVAATVGLTRVDGSCRRKEVVQVMVDRSLRLAFSRFGGDPA